MQRERGFLCPGILFLLCFFLLPVFQQKPSASIRPEDMIHWQKGEAFSETEAARFQQFLDRTRQGYPDTIHIYSQYGSTIPEESYKKLSFDGSAYEITALWNGSTFRERYTSLETVILRGSPDRVCYLLSSRGKVPYRQFYGNLWRSKEERSYPFRMLLWTGPSCTPNTSQFDQLPPEYQEEAAVMLGLDRMPITWTWNETCTYEEALELDGLIVTDPRGICLNGMEYWKDFFRRSMNGESCRLSIIVIDRLHQISFRTVTYDGTFFDLVDENGVHWWKNCRYLIRNKELEGAPTSGYYISWKKDLESEDLNQHVDWQKGGRLVKAKALKLFVIQDISYISK